MGTNTPEEERLARQRLDAELVARFRRGDREAFRELTARYYRPVSAFLLKRTGKSDVVEDLAQETFLEAFRHLSSLNRPEQFASWLFGIARNRCGKWQRRVRPVALSALGEVEIAVPFVSDVEEVEEQQRLLSRLENGLAGLNDESRRLLDMKHRQGKTCEQIASEVGRPVGTVKSLLSRAYKTLRERLRPEENGA